MRGQHPMYMQQRSMNVAASGYTGGQRPPNVQVGPEGMPMGSQANQEWRQLLMQQQQNMSFNNSGGNMRSNSFNQGSKCNSIECKMFFVILFNLSLLL